MENQRPVSSPASFAERHPNEVVDDAPLFSQEEIDEIPTELDKAGRMELPKELDQVEEVHKETSISVFQKLGIVADAERAKALSILLRGKTPESVIKKRKGRGKTPDGKEIFFSYVPGWYVKKMLNALFAMQWDFELIPIKEGELFYMSARQILVMGKLTIRDIHGVPRIVKMAIGKKEVAYQKNQDGTRSTTPMDLGNDIKAAETDALKRAATGIGIALDLYQKED